MDKITKLSQAIRLGATFRPQCTANLFHNGASCALGAAYEAVTGIGDMDTYMNNSAIVAPPAEAHLSARFDVSLKLLDEVANRNDRYHTREQIADWLEEQGL